VVKQPTLYHRGRVVSTPHFVPHNFVPHNS
jgi:hypothetical protein